MKEPPATPATPLIEPSLALQDAVLRLQQFWAAQGCLLLPPCDFAVPCASLQPDAFFAILGAEPWRAAGPQPVRRPSDGRFGEHPYRLASHLQLHVVQPPPGDVQALFLKSLEALELDLAVHDLRFEEWAWQATSLGARGSGWHALLDGLGVTRLTFLARVAERDLDPVSVGIFYRLERLMMLSQGVADAYSVRWSAHGPEAGGRSRRDELEDSRYTFEVAEVGDLRRRLEALDREAARCLEARLARPAYELAIRCLGPIDLLDARGDLSERQRASCLGRIRERVVAAADLYLNGDDGG